MDPRSEDIKYFENQAQAQAEGYTISLSRAERRRLESVPIGARVEVYKKMCVDRSKARAARKARRAQRGR
jgi:hypothetical protein